ncbi:unnamed protein product [Adineta steineri]|uniref:Uncharacterized protein n=1 Tax=Adineta steineri TaxID=433720 RepID=A0A815QRQ5_9BILA|nr:unnamed protein product [Adineta steineri]CAF1634894.1 unnamed protein product [Adineta steineri]
MSSVLADYYKKRIQLRLTILKCKEERIQLEQKLQSLSNIDSRLKQQQIDHIHSYFTQLNQESQRAKERSLQLLNDITQAERNLAQIHIDVEHLIRLKSDYSQYLETKYPTRQKSVSNETSTMIDNNIYNFDHLPQQQNTSSIHLPYESDSPTLFKRHEDQSKVAINDLHRDEQSVSESTSNTFSRSKRTDSLFGMALNRSNLYFFD